MDTGCGHDLINDRLAAGLNVRTLTRDGRLVFATANGRIESRNVVPVMCKEFNQVIQPYLLRETPPVLSIGKRCMEQGYTFHWEAGRNPIMTNPEGLIVEFEVDRNIPYFVTGSEEGVSAEARQRNESRAHFTHGRGKETCYLSGSAMFRSGDRRRE